MKIKINKQLKNEYYCAEKFRVRSLKSIKYVIYFKDFSNNNDSILYCLFDVCELDVKK